MYPCLKMRANFRVDPAVHHGARRRAVQLVKSLSSSCLDQNKLARGSRLLRHKGQLSAGITHLLSLRGPNPYSLLIRPMSATKHLRVSYQLCFHLFCRRFAVRESTNLSIAASTVNDIIIFVILYR